MYPERRTVTLHEYQKLYRFERDAFCQLSNYFLGEEKEETRGDAIPKGKKMEIFLRFSACKDFQVEVGDDIGVTQPTVSWISHEVLDLVVTKKEDIICFSRTENEVAEAKRNWNEKLKCHS